MVSLVMPFRNLHPLLRTESSLFTVLDHISSREIAVILLGFCQDFLLRFLGVSSDHLQFNKRISSGFVYHLSFSSKWYPLACSQYEYNRFLGISPPAFWGSVLQFGLSGLGSVIPFFQVLLVKSDGFQASPQNHCAILYNLGVGTFSGIVAYIFNILR